MIRKFTSFLTSGIVAVVTVAIAVVSVQNFTGVAIQFLMFKSIEFPLGVLLSLCFGGGLLLGGVLPFFLGRKPRKKARLGTTFPRNSRRNTDYLAEDDPLENWD
ncbi:MAG: lipopolysaccharide assembly protein LapA domain-containing protein [Jaaginema sp. PMC 1079.18]|nr:lipopolysaccharide assembly protein LapA domain-containing protein [Jaaginema sp. PMC 1080.18]MEC4851490.1 lipopolysaccharide assembly protein LapA domain-containing protein [Jaaginema sp. PMC 1079.18]MEC4866957.1 lipopolysaccharide assembly protein LapA domain-containing protein [Jaaginema sp. PMC 1078.18]